MKKGLLFKFCSNFGPKAGHWLKWTEDEDGNLARRTMNNEKMGFAYPFHYYYSNREWEGDLVWGIVEGRHGKKPGAWEEVPFGS